MQDQRDQYERNEKIVVNKPREFSRPSSTITAAALAGLGSSFAWEIIATFTEVTLSPGLIVASSVFVSTLVGYLKREKVLKLS